MHYICICWKYKSDQLSLLWIKFKSDRNKYVNTSYVWNQPQLHTPWFNDGKWTKFLFFLYFDVRKHERKLLSQNCNIWVMERSCLKQNDKMNFSKKSHFLKNVSKFKARYKKTVRCTHCIVQVGIRLCKKRKWKEKCATLRLMLNILSFLIVVTSLFHKWRSLLNSSKIL